MNSKLTIEERDYLTNLLNREVEGLNNKDGIAVYSIQDKLKLYPAKERNQCDKCKKIFINTRRNKKGGVYLDNIYCEQCEERFLEVPVKKGQRIILIARNGKYTELWNDNFNFNYLIKLSKMQKKGK